MGEAAEVQDLMAILGALVRAVSARLSIIFHRISKPAGMVI